MWPNLLNQLWLKTIWSISLAEEYTRSSPVSVSFATFMFDLGITTDSKMSVTLMTADPWPYRKRKCGPAWVIHHWFNSARPPPPPLPHAERNSWVERCCALVPGCVVISYSNKHHQMSHSHKIKKLESIICLTAPWIVSINCKNALPNLRPNTPDISMGQTLQI